MTNTANLQPNHCRYLGARSGFLAPFLDFFRSRTDAPTIFGLGMAFLLLGLSIPEAKVNLTPAWGHNLFVILVGRTGRARKTTALSFLDAMGIPRVPFGTAEVTIRWLSERRHGVIVVDEASSLLKRCQRPGYLEGFSEFCNRLYDRSLLEQNTEKHGLVKVENHYVSLILSTTDEGFRASVSPEMLRNGFLGRFLPLIGESVPQPRRIKEPKQIELKGLKSKLEELGEAEVSFNHSEENAMLASTISYQKGLDDWLAARSEEHVLQIADLLALDRSMPQTLRSTEKISIVVTEDDIVRAKMFVSAALASFQSLVRVTKFPHGPLLDLYQGIHNLRSEGRTKFGKGEILRLLSGVQTTAVEDALETAHASGFIRVTFEGRRGIVYRILDDPLQLA